MGITTSHYPIDTAVAFFDAHPFIPANSKAGLDGIAFPAWSWAAVDDETCVEITMLLDYYRTEFNWKTGDTRNFTRLCIVATQLFQERHATADWDEVDWRDVVDDLCGEIHGTMKVDPTWLEVTWGHSDQTVDDLRALLLEQYTPQTVSSPATPTGTDFMTLLAETLSPENP